jgi:hypothetical protein
LAENRQFLRIGLLGVDYLLPSSASFVIEKREELEAGVPGSPVAAWQATASGRVPAYSVDAELNPFARHGWQRAVFLQGASPVGLIADELQLLAREDVRIERLRPLGPAPTPTGHLFGGAWVRAGRVPVLVFEPRALSDYLWRLGGAE